MKLKLWVKSHRFVLITLVAWIILCLPQNIVTLVMYFGQDSHEIPDLQPPKKNYTCYDAHQSLKSKLQFGVRGIFNTIMASCGIILNLFSIAVLRRLAAKSGFNKLLLSLGR